ncbi:MAG TPA: L-rhamnose isomerase [Spirochaetia bacterium]|nr:L-rhamnose isomerase [Spirochaetia bacterium]
MKYDTATVKARLKDQKLGTPTWGYGDSGTRFHVLHRASHPRTLEEKLDDAAVVQKLTGVCPYVDLHTAWDKSDDWGAVRRYAADLGLRIGAINPHLFEEDDYVLGSLCNPDERVREKSVGKLLDAVGIAKAVGASVISLWFADGTDYPGQDSFRARKKRLHDGLVRVYEAMSADMRMVIEYKLFEPGFYHMDLADWGGAYMLALALGDRAQVLVDLGHHAQGANIEHIVALLLSEGKLGGFHFNDKKYGDDDLTVGAINPYQLFLIFCELVTAEMDAETSHCARQVALMIDENHNFKNPIEGTIQSVLSLQVAYARALLVDYGCLREMQGRGEVIRAEECLKDAYLTDVRPLLEEVRREMGRDPDPLGSFRRSGYMEKIIQERGS